MFGNTFWEDKECSKDATGQQRKQKVKLKYGVISTQASKQAVGFPKQECWIVGEKRWQTDGAVYKGLEV